jgi:hypothetical protein
MINRNIVNTTPVERNAFPARLDANWQWELIRTRLGIADAAHTSNQARACIHSCRRRAGRDREAVSGGLASLHGLGTSNAPAIVSGAKKPTTPAPGTEEAAGQHTDDVEALLSQDDRLADDRGSRRHSASSHVAFDSTTTAP